MIATSKEWETPIKKVDPRMENILKNSTFLVPLTILKSLIDIW